MTEQREIARLQYEKELRQQRMLTQGGTILVGALIVLLLAGLLYARKICPRWPFVTVVLYGTFLVLVVMPVLWGIGIWIGQSSSNATGFADITEIYTVLYTDAAAWPAWLFFGAMILAQACLLIIPVRTTHERPKPRRGIWLTAISAAFLYTVLLLGVLISIVSAVWGDDWPDASGWLCILILPTNWLFWSLLFRLFARSAEPTAFVRRLTKWLLRASILELLIAVPSHIIVRHKDVCCAHMATAAGIAAGLAVMLFAFGPGVYFLYVERIRSKKSG